MNSNRTVTVLAGKAVLAGALALSAVVVGAVSTHGNPPIGAALSEPCTGDNCSDPGHPVVPCPGGGCSGHIVEDPANGTPWRDPHTGLNGGKDHTQS
jgi:hypothetical protein